MTRIQNLKRVLKIDQSLMQSLDLLLVSMYNVSGFDKNLAALLLSQSAFYVKKDHWHCSVKLEAGVAVYEPSPQVFISVQQDDILIAMCPECWT
ncbi:hypothetical protein HDU77_010904, partial [Chytriomyces hyalinus]